MQKTYDEIFKRKCVELVVKEDRTIVSIKNEFSLGNGTLNDWIKQYNQIFGVRCYCHRLQVSISGFYDYMHRKPTENQKKRKETAAYIVMQFKVLLQILANKTTL